MEQKQVVDKFRERMRIAYLDEIATISKGVISEAALTSDDELVDFIDAACQKSEWVSGGNSAVCTTLMVCGNPTALEDHFGTGDMLSLSSWAWAALRSDVTDEIVKESPRLFDLADKMQSRRDD